MKKIAVAMILVAGLNSCKKEAEHLMLQANNEIELSASSPCTGNVWTETGNFSIRMNGNLDRFNLVYQNKMYMPSYSTQKVYIYDGSTWSAINSAVPLNWNSGFSFTIGAKGYLSQGGYGSNGKKLWEYSFANNTWLEKETFPGLPRYNAAVFVIDNKAYVAGGSYAVLNGTATSLRDVWEYDPGSANPWTAKANINNLFYARTGAAGFAAGNKGYLACGSFLNNGSYLYLKELLEYNPSTDSWIKKADFPGQVRAHAHSFVLSNVGYVGLGDFNSFTVFKDFYKYNQSANSWIKIADAPQSLTNSAFSINSKGYVIDYVEMYNNGPMYKYSPQSCITNSPF